MVDLVLFALSGRLHAARSTEIIHIEETAGFFRLPLHPPQVAGLILIDENPVTLTDLAACLGYPAEPRSSRGSALFLAGYDRETAFFVADCVHRESVPEQSLLPAPNSLKYPLVSHCVLLGGELMPILELSVLRARLERGEWAPPAAALEFSQHRSPLELCNSFSLVHFGGRIFAIPRTELRELAETAVKICTVGNAPPFLLGIGSTENDLRPVVQLEPLLDLSPGPSHVFVVAEIEGLKAILRTDRLETETLETENCLALPPLVQRRGMRSALLTGSQMIPLLDLAEMFENALPLPPLPERYSSEDDVDGHSEDSFLEFSLPGARFAVPGAEVETVLPILPIHDIPSDLPLLRGVAVHRGVLWPVIDLAPYFGQESREEEGCRLLAVQKEDFRALVVAGEIYGETRPGRENLRQLPLNLPHHLVYGCYLKSEEVIIVLNVKAMALNFDPALVKIRRDIVLADEPDQPDALEAASNEETKEETPEDVRETTGADLESSSAHFSETDQPIEHPAEAHDMPKVPPSFMPPQAVPLHLDAESAESAQRLREIESSSSSVPQQIVQPTDDSGEEETEETIDLSGEWIRIEEENDVQAIFHKSDNIVAVSPEPREAPVRAQEVALEEVESSTNISDPIFSETSSDASDPPTPPPPPVPQREASLPGAPTHQEICSSPGGNRLSETPPHSTPEEDPKKTAVPSLPAAPPPVEDRSREEARPHGRSRREGSSRLPSRAAVIAILLLCLSAGGGYYLHLAEGPVLVTAPPSPANGRMPQETALPVVVPVPHENKNAETPPPSPATRVVEAPTPEPPSPTVAAEPIPPTGARRATYRVVSGDTLWDIARRRTGNPFFYREIADKNAIADPNRIYPGQEITLP